MPRQRSLFDIIGPVMIGPSSSHTAGAARLGALARAIAGGTPR
ncbi:MAG: L-serine ammonia-lyase, iron-sulfur-dependent, subunit beta, partial [Anaerosomatales bacterium]|nr:L-serine ammonia-lyase, iron-sulfur-dependent, subunit beta [Anaerosomatales bacterium]